MSRIGIVLLVAVLSVALTVSSAEAKGGKGGGKGGHQSVSSAEVFARADSDKDGTLTQKEFVAYEQTHQKKFDESKAIKTFGKLGGSADKGIKQDDFVKAMDDLKAKAKAKADAKKGKK